MTDMRRTLLWVVFTMSLVLLWDRWTVHTGHPSMFGGSRAGGHRARRRTSVGAGVPAAGVPAPSSAAVPGAVPRPAHCGNRGANAAAPTPAAPGGEVTLIPT